jgi:SAM-dependent methyltransferase
MKDARWADRIGDEAAHWRSWFAADEYAEERRARLQVLSSSFSQPFVESIGVKPGELLRVLDVGSGPIPTLPSNAPENMVQVVCTDPLADSYSVLLDEYGYGEVPRPLKIKGEELSAIFAEGSFHYVHIANALDHCEDPVKILTEMYRVCRSGGLVDVFSCENEGERRGYRGLHQWNLKADDEGLWLWNSSLRQNLLDCLGSHTYTWAYVDHGPPESGYFRVSISKRDSGQRDSIGASSASLPRIA